MPALVLLLAWQMELCHWGLHQHHVTRKPVIAMYVQKCIMLLKCHAHATYDNVFMWRYETTMLIYMPQNMNPLQSRMWAQTLVYLHSTLLAFSPEQICLPLCPYMFCYAMQFCFICTILLGLSRGILSHILLAISGALHYTTLIFGFPSLCTFRQY